MASPSASSYAGDAFEEAIEVNTSQFDHDEGPLVIDEQEEQQQLNHMNHRAMPSNSVATPTGRPHHV